MAERSYPDLLEEIETARVGDRNLDADVYEFLGYKVRREGDWRFFNEASRRWEKLPHLSTALEDVTRAIERLLPEWSFGSGHGPAGKSSFASHIYRPGKGGPIDVRGFGDTEALARLSGLIRAYAREHNG